MAGGLQGILKFLFEDKPKELTEFPNAGERHYLGVGDYLFHQGENSTSFYVLLHGRLRAISSGNNGLVIWVILELESQLANLPSLLVNREWLPHLL